MINERARERDSDRGRETDMEISVVPLWADLDLLSGDCYMCPAH